MYVIKDYLGSSRVMVNSTEDTVAFYDYTPFGDRMRTSDNWTAKYMFTGQEKDEETGLYNYRARLYDPYLKRFLDTDPAGQGFSPYAYAGNNPVVFVDPSGMFLQIIPYIAETIVVTAEATTTITAIESFTAAAITVAGVTYTASQMTAGTVITDMASGLNYNYYGDNIWYTTEIPQNYAIDPLTGSGFEIPADPILRPALPQSGAIEPLWIQPGDLIPTSIGAKLGATTVKAVGSSIWPKIASGVAAITGANATKFGMKSSQKLLNTARQNLLNNVNNLKLKNVIKNLYKEKAKIGSGSSMDAVRFEKLTGKPIGGKYHTLKIIENRTALQKLWRNKHLLTPKEREIVKQLLKDIQDAL